MKVTRRLFMAGTAATAGALALPFPLLAKPRLAGFAYSVGNECQGNQVVWAPDARSALNWAFGDCFDDCQRFSGGDCCDECGHLDLERTPIFDGFQETGIPLTAYRRAGWHMPCQRCEEAGVYKGAFDASDRCAEDWHPLPAREGGFVAVCTECMTIHELLAYGGMDLEHAAEWKHEFWHLPYADLSFNRHAA